MKSMYCIALASWIACAPALATPAPDGAPGATLTLEVAWRRAEERNLAVVEAKAALMAAEGALTDTQGLLWNNPELSVDRTRRQTPQADLSQPTYREWSAGISQTLEIAGQQGFRRDSAREAVAAARYHLEATLRDSRADVERQFVQVLALDARVANEARAVALVDSTATFAGKRVTAGEDNRLDGNVARIDAGRARGQLALIQDQLIEAKLRLAELLQWQANELPVPVGDVEISTAVPPLTELLVTARERAVLKSLYAKEAAADSRLKLERAARFPDITVGVALGREGGEPFRERVTTLTVSVPLPLFKRNSGNVAQAQADRLRAQTARAAGEREVEAGVRAQWSRVQVLAARVSALRASVLPALEENQRLSQTALREGELSLTQQILINRQVLEGQRDLLDAVTELRLARIALAQAAGVSTTFREVAP